MPAFLLKRIQSLKEYSDIEIYVAEWSIYSLTYVVQRDQIKNLVGDNFISFEGKEELQKNIVKYCYDKNIDIIHIEESPEGFDSFNSFPEYIQEDLYNKKHPWKIIESPHGMWFDPSKNKKFLPHGFACVTFEHANKTYKFPDVKTTLIPFPIDISIQSNKTREEILENHGYLTKGEFHILNVGLWTRGKNQSYAVDIAKKLYDKYGFTYIFHFIGNQAPNFKNYWEPVVKDLTPNIKIWGERTDTDKFYKMSDLMLFTSTWECNPIVLKEAISNNIKIMANNLDHYGDEYLQYITPLTKNITQDTNKLIDVIHSQNKYDPYIINDVRNFALQHLDFYKKLIDGKK